MASLYSRDGGLMIGGVGFLHHLTSAAQAVKRAGDERHAGRAHGLAELGLDDRVDDHGRPTLGPVDGEQEIVDRFDARVPYLLERLVGELRLERRDEHVVPQEAELPVRVAGRRDELPAVHVLAGFDEGWVALVADERPVDGALADELGGHVVGSSVELEPTDKPLRPGGIPPDELALCVVESALYDARPRQLVEIGGGADVIRVEVGDEDRRDAPAGLLELGGPDLLCLG